MSVEHLSYTITGTKPLLMNNPQCVDRFNEIAKQMAVITAKGKRRTDEDYLLMRDLEMTAKIYWDDELGIYVPARWIAAALAKISFTQAKISKASIRGGVFVDGDKMKLSYKRQRAVKEKDDVIFDGHFRHLMLLPQGQIRVAKVTPIFHGWSFSGGLEYDNKIVDRDTLVQLLKYAAEYGGFGDFRPTFGRAKCEVSKA